MSRVTRAAKRAHSEIDETPKVPGASDHGMNCKIQRLYRTEPDRAGQTGWTTIRPKVHKVVETEETAKFALLVRYDQCYDGRREFTVNSIVVQNRLLKDIVGEVLEGYKGIVTDMHRLELNPPWRPFVHRWNKLTEVMERLVAQAKKDTDDSCIREKRDLVILLHDLLHEELKDTIVTLADLVRQSVISSNLLWALFEPGCIAFSGDQAYKVESTSVGMGGQVVNCEYVDWDGHKFGYASKSAIITSFNGVMPIQQLPIYPLRFHKDEFRKREELLTRASKFQSLCGFRYQQYNGIGTTIGSGLMAVSSRIVLDTLSWIKFNPSHDVKVAALNPTKKPDRFSTRTSIGRDYNFDGSNITPATYTIDFSKGQPITNADSEYADAGELTEEQKLITTSALRGYSCKDKRWMFFKIDGVSDIVWDDNAFDSLVMPEDQKRLVRAVAESQAQQSKIFDDVITGKGRGMILLLAGPPGVGKTLTAESVAEVMKVPLYYMSSSDLGSTVEGVETKLSKIFELVTKWRAVLLLDEADVFLQKRDDQDIERNRLVSVMLRTLEYYEGLLMLTTNRSESIDDAFQSRIHLRLHYSDLTEDSRHVIWKNFLATSKYNHQFSNCDLKDLATKNLNGRQIKNLLKTAVLLAARKGEALKKSHIEFVLKIDPQA